MTNNQSSTFWEWIGKVGPFLLAVILGYYSIRSYYNTARINEDIYRPLVYIGGHENISNDNEARITFSLGNSGQHPARITAFNVRSHDFKLGDYSDIEMILSPTGLIKRTIAINEPSSSSTPFQFTLQIYYYSLFDKNETNKYCIEYQYKNIPEQGQLGIEKALACD